MIRHFVRLSFSYFVFWHYKLDRELENFRVRVRVLGIMCMLIVEPKLSFLVWEHRALVEYMNL